MFSAVCRKRIGLCRSKWHKSVLKTRGSSALIVWFPTYRDSDCKLSKRLKSGLAGQSECHQSLRARLLVLKEQLRTAVLHCDIVYAGTRMSWRLSDDMLIVASSWSESASGLAEFKRCWLQRRTRQTTRSRVSRSKYSRRSLPANG